MAIGEPAEVAAHGISTTRVTVGLTVDLINHEPVKIRLRAVSRN